MRETAGRSRDAEPSQAGWRGEVRVRFGINPLDSPPPARRDVFWATRCARIKAEVDAGQPDDLYQSPINRAFYRFVHHHGLRFGVVSDLYGLHLDRERLAAYDVHPSELTPDAKRRLGKLLGEKVRAEGFGTLIFYNNSPIRSRPYFEILAASDLDEIFYCTRLAKGGRP